MKRNRFLKLPFCYSVIILSLFLTTTTFSGATDVLFQPDNVSTSYDTIIIPDDFLTIQEAIDYCQPGDHIFVRKGTYTDHVRVNKDALTISGECNKDTIIDMENTAQDAIQIISDDVVIQNFSIINARSKDNVIWDQAGIEVYSSHITIRNNIFVDNRLGIHVFTSAYDLTICDNQFFHDGIMIGNYMETGDIPLSSVLHTITNNTVNDRPLYYIRDSKDMMVPTDAGQILLANCTNITVKDIEMSHTDFSIMLLHCSFCLVENCTVSDTDGELILLYSHYNIIQNNTAINNMHGICIDHSSSYNTVRYNDVSENYVGISIITHAHNNDIYGNLIHDNNIGVKLTTYAEGLPAFENNVYDNVFQKNKCGLKIYPTLGIRPPAYNNTIDHNLFTMNLIGVNLIDTKGTTIKNNTFLTNPIASFFTDTFDTIWENNYWGRPRLLPKAIIGLRHIGGIPFPYLNFDVNPAKQRTV